MVLCNRFWIASFGLIVFVSAMNPSAQESSPTPSQTNPTSPRPFVAGPALAAPAAPGGSPTATPDVDFPAQPLSTPAPQPSATPSAQAGGAPRAMPITPREVITRLQIFLDQRNFGPGKIDGGWGEFTAK